MDEKRAKKILIVEDDPDVHEMLRGFMRICGFESEGVRTGSEALNFIYDKNKKYDLYIIDYALSDINGFEIYKELRTVESSAPVIFYTSFQRLVSARTNGVDDPNVYIFPKTSSPEKLTALVKNLLDKG
ncbi:MAG: response regulator [bacterium]